MLNVDDVEEASTSWSAAPSSALVGAFIPVSPIADRPVSPSDLRPPLVDRAGPRPAAAHAHRHAARRHPRLRVHDEPRRAHRRRPLHHRLLGALLAIAMIFSGVFDRYPKLRVGSVEHEAAWIPHWLKQMDFTYRERPVFTKGWTLEGRAPAHRLLAPQHVRRVHGGRPRRPAARPRSAWTPCCGAATSRTPSRRGRRSRQFLDRIFAGMPEPDLRKITSDNAARMFGFKLD